MVRTCRKEHVGFICLAKHHQSTSSSGLRITSITSFTHIALKGTIKQLTDLYREAQGATLSVFVVAADVSAASENNDRSFLGRFNRLAVKTKEVPPTVLAGLYASWFFNQSYNAWSLSPLSCRSSNAQRMLLPFAACASVQTPRM